MITKYDRYRENLIVVNNDVISYTTKVAKIDRERMIIKQLGYWSVTTQRHINYVAQQEGLTLIK
tara:strand:+ start:1701 stop:1892 length:192 start_codon:yes stop_codon:yes gene_type:complete